MTTSHRAALALALLISPAPAAMADDAIGDSGPSIGYRGCIYYEHRDYGGASRAKPGNTRVMYVGDWWNDKISSFRCGDGCSMAFYEHRDFGGAWDRWTNNISYVGDNWNDDISSVVVKCR
jgi:hypothetical protein